MQYFFFIRAGSKYIKVSFHEIAYVEGCKNYVRLVTDVKTYIVMITMKRIAEILPVFLFCRIHKSYIIAINRVMAFDNTTVYYNEKNFPLGGLYKKYLQQSVIILATEIHELNLMARQLN